MLTPNPKAQLSTKSISKILLLWLPILLWYAIALLTEPGHALLWEVDGNYYYPAAQHWLSGTALYNGTGYGFVYLPTTALLLAPLGLLPMVAFEVLFRIISITFLSMGIYQFVISTTNTNQKQAFFFSLLSTVLISQAAFMVGQMHILTTGVLLLGFAAITREKWWQAAIFLTLSLALKPTSIVLFLLGMGLYPKLGWRLALTTLIALASSFILQSPAYVWAQYQSFFSNFMVAMHFDSHHAANWATFFGAIAFYTGHQVNGMLQFGSRIAMAFVVFLIAIYSRLKLDRQQAVFFIFTLGMCYLMLFNSRTEDNDYLMIAPILGYTLFLAWQERNKILLWAISLAIFGLVINWTLSRAITPHNNLWLSPTIITLFTIYILKRLASAICDRSQSPTPVKLQPC